MSKYTQDQLQGMAMHVIASEAMGDMKATEFYQRLASQCFEGNVNTARFVTASLAGV